MSKRFAARMTVIAALAVMVPVASLATASSAMAAPKGIFSIFSNCPLASFKALGVSPGEAICTYNTTSGGELAIGSTKVPINSGVNAGKTVTLEGGGIPTGNPENEVEYYALPGANGESLSKTELNVPGGLLDIVNCEEIKGSGFWEVLERAACKATFENPKTTGVTAVTEVVANTTNPVIVNEYALDVEKGTALTLPVRIHLKNPLLGNSCYIGSEASPIELHLTTGATSPKSPNKSIHGKRGKLETLEEGELSMLRISNNSLVDNAFSVPKAEGCGEFFSFLIDPVVDAKLKLPSEDGNNTAELNGTLNTATAEAVEASEK
jgi:hypothetical protein